MRRVPSVTGCPLHWGFGPNGGDDDRPYLALVTGDSLHSLTHSLTHSEQ